jgi:hypothetical protein
MLLTERACSKGAARLVSGRRSDDCSGDAFRRCGEIDFVRGGCVPPTRSVTAREVGILCGV